MAAMPRKDFPGRPCGFSTEATPPHSGLLSFQPTFLLLLIAQLAVGKAMPGKKWSSKWSSCDPPYAPLPSPPLSSLSSSTGSGVPALEQPVWV